MFNLLKSGGAALGGSKEDETIAIIDKLQPALTGENPRQRLSLFFCFALFAIFVMGLLIGCNAGLTVEKEQPLITHIALFLAAVLCAGVCALASVRFIQTFKILISSPDSKEESQQAERAAQPKAAQETQAQQPRIHTRKDR